MRKYDRYLNLGYLIRGLTTSLLVGIFEILTFFGSFLQRQYLLLDSSRFVVDPHIVNVGSTRLWMVKCINILKLKLIFELQSPSKSRMRIIGIFNEK